MFVRKLLQTACFATVDNLLWVATEAAGKM